MAIKVLAWMANVLEPPSDVRAVVARLPAAESVEAVNVTQTEYFLPLARAA